MFPELINLYNINKKVDFKSNSILLNIVKEEGIVRLINEYKSSCIIEKYMGKNYDDFSKENWDDISHKYRLSEDFIDEFREKVNWRYISQRQTLSENFIRKYQDKVNWQFIPVAQKLSNDFLLEFLHKFDINDYYFLNKFDFAVYPFLYQSTNNSTIRGYLNFTNQ